MAAPAAAFRLLQRDLLRRRFQSVGIPLWLGVAFLAVYSTMVVAGRLAPHIQHTRKIHGAPAAAVLVAAVLGGVAALTALVVASRCAHHARRGMPGPEWSGLPADRAQLLGHLAWEARLWRWLSIPPAAGVLLSGSGAMAWWQMLLFGAGYLLALEVAARGACLIVGHRSAVRDRGSTSGAPGPSHAQGAGIQQLPIQPRGAVRTLVRNDWRLTKRRTQARSSALGVAGITAALTTAALLSLSGLTEWASLVLQALIGVAVAEWLLALSADAPGVTLRSLPLSPWSLWAGRALLGVAALAVSALIPLVIALWSGSRSAHGEFLAAATALGVALLGANYAVAFLDRGQTARWVFAWTLAAILAIGIAMPLLGAALFGLAALESARRVHRWHRTDARW